MRLYIITHIYSLMIENGEVYRDGITHIDSGVSGVDFRSFFFFFEREEGREERKKDIYLPHIYYLLSRLYIY
jgi:hypothetical protein